MIQAAINVVGDLEKKGYATTYGKSEGHKRGKESKTETKPTNETASRHFTAVKVIES